MRRATAMTALALLMSITGCRQHPQFLDGMWYPAADLDEALAVAGKQGTMVLLDFYSDT